VPAKRPPELTLPEREKHLELMDYALGAVSNEVRRQDMLWGTAETQEQDAAWRLVILAEEFGEYSMEVCKRDLWKQRAELVQTAAVAVANIMRIDAGVEKV